MTNWESIQRNCRKHGDFAGRITTEQDAFYAFFAQCELRGPKVNLRNSGQVCMRLQNIWAVRALRWPLVRVSSLWSTSTQ